MTPQPLIAIEPCAEHKIPTRRSGLDAAKFFAAIGVIWIHACRSTELASLSQMARFAVPFFAVAATYSLVRSIAKKQPTWIQFAIQKWTRLYLPFLIWSIGYLLFKLGKRYCLPDQECALPSWELCWVGGAYHLWFIPFLVISSLVLFPILILVQRGVIKHRVAATISAIIGLSVAIAVPVDDGSGDFGCLVGQALPGIFWGCSLGWCDLSESTNRSKGALVLTASVSFIVCLICLGWFSRETLIENAAGCGLLLVALNFDYVRIPSWLSLGGQLSFGIYFAHLMILKVGESLASKFHFEATAFLDMALFLMTALIATSFAYGLSRWAPTRWLVM